ALSGFCLGEADRVREPVADAAALFDGLGDEALAAHHPAMAIWLGWAEVCCERFDEAIRHLERGIVVSRACGQRHLTVPLLAVQGQALGLTGQLERAAEVALAAVDAAVLAEASREWAMRLRCTVATLTGDLYAAVGFGERGLGAGGVTGGPLSGNGLLPLAE